MTTTTSKEIKKRTNMLLVGTAGTFLNRRLIITAARLVSVVCDGDGDVNDFEHICMLHCLTVISGQWQHSSDIRKHS